MSMLNVTIVTYYASETQPLCLQAVLGQYGSPPAGQTRTCFHLHSETTEMILITINVLIPFIFLCKGKGLGLQCS